MAVRLKDGKSDVRALNAKPGLYTQGKWVMQENLYKMCKIL